MLTGAHVVIFSEEAEADRAFLSALLQGDRVDAGGGWLIFALPPAEIAVHPAERGGAQEFYLMTDNLDGMRDRVSGLGGEIGPATDEGWGIVARLTLPSGAAIGIYEPRHAVPAPPDAASGG